MKTYVLCDSDSGKIISSSKAPILKVAPSREVIQTEKVGRWDASIKDFVDFPVDKRMSHREFLQRLDLYAPGSFFALLTEAKKSIAIEAFILEWTVSGVIDLADPKVVGNLNSLTPYGIFWTDEQIQAVIDV